MQFSKSGRKEKQVLVQVVFQDSLLKCTSRAKLSASVTGVCSVGANRGELTSAH